MSAIPIRPTSTHATKPSGSTVPVVRSQLSYSVSSRRAPAAARVPRLDRMPAYDNLRNMVGEIECGVAGIPSTHRPRDRRTAVSKTPPSLRHDRVGAGLNDRFYRPDGSGSSRRQPLASDVRPPALVSSRSQSPAQTLQQMAQSASPDPLRSNPPLADGRLVLPSTRYLSFAQRASLAMAQAACPPPLDDLPLPLPRIPSVHGAGRRSARQIVQWRQPGPSRLANIDWEAEDDE
ncbi:hypothetical protein CMQ_2725 [Grosmannia clavigera kw1407]|uniref:Uncharacterized protein n=1 Tax=Grosmannia clavigera (strain kw1407 / UAMH 11150) TaxID=655863 RepID=F0XI70_GROCL|nr:uncharacterized protein CMQ_2725 [Grosmannia clavigera kw1407]EFX02796.1 hypothetical protein CMQ_2725 [Grosmannia clavigera kw1407]